MHLKIKQSYLEPPRLKDQHVLYYLLRISNVQTKHSVRTYMVPRAKAKEMQSNTGQFHLIPGLAFKSTCRCSKKITFSYELFKKW